MGIQTNSRHLMNLLRTLRTLGIWSACFWRVKPSFCHLPDLMLGTPLNARMGGHIPLTKVMKTIPGNSPPPSCWSLTLPTVTRFVSPPDWKRRAR